MPERTPSTPVLLVVDDEPAICTLLRRCGERLGFRVETFGDGRETLAHLATVRPDVALVDVHMPEVDGLAMLRAIRDARPACQVALMTGHATVDTAIEAVKLGASDYLRKPLAVERVTEILENVRAEVARRAVLFATDREVGERLGLCGMIGRSAAMQDLFDLLRRIAPHARTALVLGETGTGKELVARALHDLGPRRERRFLTVNCSAVVESLFESELFGHVRGAFTGATDAKAGLFEAAHGGTLFLDEVGELPPAVQAKLLRALESGEVQRVGSLESRRVDVHVVAATNRDLATEAAAGRFRQDLLYRLNIVQFDLPPLRSRRDDIPYLTAVFVARCGERIGRSFTGLTPAAERLLHDYAWPGNVRELRNVIERLCLLADGPTLTEHDVARALPASAGGATEPALGDAGPPPSPAAASASVLQQQEMAEIQRVLERHRGNKAAAARALGVSRRLLYRRLEKYALAAPSAPARTPARAEPHTEADDAV